MINKIVQCYTNLYFSLFSRNLIKAQFTLLFSFYKYLPFG